MPSYQQEKKHFRSSINKKRHKNGKAYKVLLYKTATLPKVDIGDLEAAWNQTQFAPHLGGPLMIDASLIIKVLK